MNETPPPIDAETETQQRVAALVRAIDVSAPPSLHRSIRAMTDAAPRPRRARSGRPLSLAGALAGAAVLAIVLVLALGGGGSSAPSVLQASTLALRPATLDAPEESSSVPGRLAISAAGIAYPYWGQHFGWQAVGARTDRLGGRTVTTVFYVSGPGTVGRTPAARRIGYSIVGGSALAIPAVGRTAVWHGVRFQVLRSGHATVVTWRRAGHTCILVGSGVSSRTLLTLANWRAT
jgi:hypothetical protein